MALLSAFRKPVTDQKRKEAYFTASQGQLVRARFRSNRTAVIAGWALIGRIGSVSPTSGQLLNIESITAVVIGGTSLFGGVGTILGTVIGALLIGVLTNGLVLLNVSSFIQQIVIGVILVAAVALDQYAAGRRAAR